MICAIDWFDEYIKRLYVLSSSLVATMIFHFGYYYYNNMKYIILLL
jgi:hypothetical protein